MKPGPAFKPILDALYDMQLEGAFFDERGGAAALGRVHTS
jgi:hypothetical protein